MIRAQQKLKEYFGYDSFRGDQYKIIEEIISGNSALAIMPTGAGKSVCYQIPALVLEGVCIVVSPLIALMQDQINSLKFNGVKAECINSTLSHSTRLAIKEKVEAGDVDMLYVSPEKLLEPSFYNWIKTLKLSLFAIDEAHCVSQWGHDFRPEYVNLACIVNDFPNTPRIALTATANENTRLEISKRLGLDNSAHFISGFDRPNIHYTIQEKRKEKEQLLEYIEKNHPNSCGVVYCLSRKRTEEFTQVLNDAGYTALTYHAGLTIDTKASNLDRFLKEDNVIMVATVAFGMGIDKPNVRFVCHMDLPSSVEAYYQETGRAGRDGLPSNAWMLYGLKDVVLRRNMTEKSEAEEIYKRIERNNLNSIFTLCEINQCRRQTLLGYFGDSLENPCGNCDNCDTPPDTFDATVVAQKALSTAHYTGQIFGINYLIDVLLGKTNEKIKKNNHDKLSVYGIGTELNSDDWKTLFRQLAVMQFISIDTKYGSIKLTEKSRSILKSEYTLLLAKFKDKTKVSKKKKIITELDDLNLNEMDIFEQLKTTRSTLAKESGSPAYTVASNKTLIALSKQKPLTLNDCESIEGMGKVKIEKYGQLFIDIIKSGVSN
jgi:ATP-dependent DNA helicase RecQ